MLLWLMTLCSNLDFKDEREVSNNITPIDKMIVLCKSSPSTTTVLILHSGGLKPTGHALR